MARRTNVPDWCTAVPGLQQPRRPGQAHRPSTPQSGDEGRRPGPGRIRAGRARRRPAEDGADQGQAWAVGHGISEQAIAAAMPPDRPPRRFRTDRPERSRAGSAAQVRPPATTAGEFTAETTALWSDEQLEQALTEVWDDQQAVDAIATLIDSRQAADDAVARAMAGQFEDPRAQAWSTEPGWARRDELVDPGLRPTSRLTADQQLRADYETYVDTQWLQAEADCNGQLLTPAARQMGLDSRSLFSGSTSRAVKYASEELQSWWQRHGRLTLAAFRHQAFGRDSDRSAAEQARLGHFDNAAAW